MPRLPRLIVRKVPLWPLRPTEPRRMSSPAGGSHLRPAGPMAARFIVQNGAAMAWVTSTTRSPASGFIARAPSAAGLAVGDGPRGRTVVELPELEVFERVAADVVPIGGVQGANGPRGHA